MTTTRLILARELKASKQTAIALIPSPGPGRFVTCGLITVRFTAGSEALTQTALAALNLQIGSGIPAIDGGTGCFVDQAATDYSTWANYQYDGLGLTATTDTMTIGLTSQFGNRLALAVDQPICLTTHVSDPADPGGNASNDCMLQIDVEYTIHLVQNPIPPRIISQQPSR